MAGSNAEAGLRRIMDKAGVRGAERQRIERQLSSTETALGIFQLWKDAPRAPLQSGSGMTQPNLLEGFQLYVDPDFGPPGHETFKVNIRPVLRLAGTMRSPILIAAVDQLWGIHARLEVARTQDRADTMRDPAAAFVGLEEAVKVGIAIINMVQANLLPLPNGVETPAQLKGVLARIQSNISQATRERVFAGQAVNEILNNVYSSMVTETIQALDNAR